MSLLFEQMNTYQEKDVLNPNQTSLRSTTETPKLPTISPMCNSTLAPDEEAIEIVAKTSDVFNATLSPIQIVSASEKPSIVETESILTSSPAVKIPGEVERESTSIEPTVLESTDIEVQSDESYSSKSIISSQSDNSSAKGNIPKSVNTSLSSVSKKTRSLRSVLLFSGSKMPRKENCIIVSQKGSDTVVNVPDPFEVQWRAASKSHLH